MNIKKIALLEDSRMNHLLNWKDANLHFFKNQCERFPDGAQWDTFSYDEEQYWIDEKYNDRQIEQIFFRAYILSLCIFIERKLIDLCRFFNKEFNSQDTFNVLLSHLGDVFDKDEFSKVADIRNFLAHEKNDLLNSKNKKEKEILTILREFNVVLREAIEHRDGSFAYEILFDESSIKKIENFIQDRHAFLCKFAK